MLVHRVPHNGVTIRDNSILGLDSICTIEALPSPPVFVEFTARILGNVDLKLGQQISKGLLN